MVIVVMDCGKNMKGKRLADVLDEDFGVQDMVIDKFKALIKRIEDTNPNIDDFNYRWVEHKLEEMEAGILPEKDELIKANNIWNKYK